MTTVNEIAALERKLKAVSEQAGVLADIQEIRKLQFKYGYYMDKCLWQEVVDLFAEAGELHFMGAIWRGKESVARLYVGRLGGSFTKGHNGPIDGLLTEYPMFQDIVTVAPDRKTAKGRFRYLQMAGSHVTMSDAPPHLPQQWWEAGVYENEYVKDAGVWKIRLLGHNLAWQCDYQTGWRYSQPISAAIRVKYPEDPFGPDEIMARFAAPWPKAALVPFHYAHPVTGKPIAPDWQG